MVGEESGAEHHTYPVIVVGMTELISCTLLRSNFYYHVHW